MRRLEAEKAAAESDAEETASTADKLTEEEYAGMTANKASIVAALTVYVVEHDPKTTVPVLRAQLDAYLKEKGMIQ